MIPINYPRMLASVIGALLAFLKPTFPFMLVCTIFILADCISAFLLSQRVKKQYPEKRKDSKFHSKHSGKVVITLVKVYLLIVLAFLVETYIFEGLPIRLSNIVAGAVCFWQAWSILENESSCSKAKWAKIAQKILVDKTERHFDVDLSDLKDKQIKTEKNGTY